MSESNDIYNVPVNAGRLVLLFVFVCGTFLQGCTPAKRLARLEKKHPELFSSDTAVSFDVRPGVEVDTVRVLREIDTLVLSDTRTRIYRHYDTFKVVQSVPPCTTRIERITQQRASAGPDHIKNLIVALCTMLVAFIILVWITRRK